MKAVLFALASVLAAGFASACSVPSSSNCGGKYYTASDINTALNAGLDAAASGDRPNNCECMESRTFLLCTTLTQRWLYRPSRLLRHP